MLEPALLRRWHLDGMSLSFMSVTFMTGMVAALMMPTLSLFLTNEVQVRPLLVGLFYTVNALTGIVVSQLLARRSDDRGSRKRLILGCCLSGIAGGALFAVSREYGMLLTFGVLLLSLAATATPQVFALAREYTDSEGRPAVMFTSVMRAQFSLAWVLGPPLAFAVAAQWGFSMLFMAGSLVYWLCALLVWRRLPDLARPADRSGQAAGGFRRDADVRRLFFCSLLMWTCNSMYLINMPLYVSHELGLSQGLAGWMMGTAAGLEIPVMLLAGHYCGRVGKKPLMLLAGLAGCLFYVGMSQVQAPALLLGMQACNAVFIGIVAGIGMAYFQDLMPGKPGQATTLFTTSARSGSILAGGLAGVVAEWWSYHGVFVVAIGLALLALGMGSRVRNA